MIKRSVILLVLALTIALAFPAVRGSADNWLGGFVRDALGNLDVNIAASGGSSLTAISPQSDATSNATSGLAASVFNYAFNGSTWDRLKDTGTQIDGVGTQSVGVASTASYNYGFNGTNWDRLRTDGNTSGTLRVANGGAKTSAVAAAAGTVTISALPGRLVSILITVAGTVSTTCYDNNAAASGTIIGITPATTAVGNVYTFNMPATSGITCSNPASSAGFTAAYN